MCREARDERSLDVCKGEEKGRLLEESEPGVIGQSKSYPGRRVRIENNFAGEGLALSPEDDLPTAGPERKGRDAMTDGTCSPRIGWTNQLLEDPGTGSTSDYSLVFGTRPGT